MFVHTSTAAGPITTESAVAVTFVLSQISVAAIGKIAQATTALTANWKDIGTSDVRVQLQVTDGGGDASAGTATFNFYVETAATDMDILTDGTDKFKGAILTAIDDGAKKAFYPAAANDVITMNGGTKGGLVGSIVSITAIDDDAYLVHSSLLKGTATIVTPFADS